MRRSEGGKCREAPTYPKHLTPGSGVRWLGTTSVAPAQVKRGVRPRQIPYSNRNAKTAQPRQQPQDIQAKTYRPRHTGQDIQAKTYRPRHADQDTQATPARPLHHSTSTGPAADRTGGGSTGPAAEARPNMAVEPTPTAFAPSSLRLLARLTAGVGPPRTPYSHREAKTGKPRPSPQDSKAKTATPRQPLRDRKAKTCRPRHTGQDRTPPAPLHTHWPCGGSHRR